MPIADQSKIFVFNDIPIGKRFKTGADVTYQKISTKQAKPILDATGATIANGRVSTAFYNSKIRLVLV
jgi:hypothetical protein